MDNKIYFEHLSDNLPELKARFNSFVVTAFDDSMTVEMQLRALVKWIKKNIELTNDMVDYLNKFIETFDKKLYNTLEDILNKWVDDGIFETLLNEVVLPNSERDWVNARSFGVTPGIKEDQSVSLQKAIDYCIEKGKGLYIPTGTIQIDNTIYIRDSITIEGKSSSTYGSNRTSSLIHRGDKDFTLLHIERPGGKTCPSVKLKSFGVTRVRNKHDDGYDPTDESTWYLPGTKCTGIYAHIDESSFDDVLVVGMKNGIVFENSQIVDVSGSDIIYNYYGVTYNKQNPRFTFNHNNIYRNKNSLLYNTSGSQHHYTNDHFEQSENHIVINIENSSARLTAVRNITFENVNFVQYSKNSKSLLEINSFGEGYTYILPLNFVRCSVLQQYGDIVTNSFKNTGVEIELRFDNNTILTNGVLVRGGNANTPRVYYSGTPLNYTGGKVSEETFFGNANVLGLNNSNLQFYQALKLPKYDYRSIKLTKEATFFYSEDSHSPAFYNESETRNDIIKSFSFGNKDNKTPPFQKVLNGTVAVNNVLREGGTFGWVYSSTEKKYLPFGALGVKTGNGVPNYPPDFLGQEYFDKVQNTFYKAYGDSKISDWKKIVNITDEV